MHGADHVALVADQAEVDRIAGNALTGERHHRKFGEPLLVLVMSPQRRQDDIGEQPIGAQDDQQDEPGAAHADMPRRYRLVSAALNISHGAILAISGREVSMIRVFSGKSSLST